MVLTRPLRRGSRQRNVLSMMAVALVALVLVAVMANRPAAGHAEPVESDPPIGSTLPVAPERVTVIFSEEVVAGGTDLTVTGPDGSPANLGDSTLDLDDLARVTVSVGLRPDLAPGTYTVNWRSLSAEDDDREEGSFTFNVGHGSTPAASPGASPSASPDASSSASPVIVGS